MRNIGYNKFDRYIFFLIASLAAGNIGGSLQFVRVLGIIFLPKFFSTLKYTYKSYLQAPKQFVLFFLIWCAFSFLWTPDKKNGIVDFIYFIVHFAIFFEIIVFSVRAKRPFMSISLGWGVAFFATAIIAMWELQTGSHLATSKLEEGFLQNRGGGEIIVKQFAAATFYNYNMYELFICYCMPFIIFLNLIANKLKYTVLYFVLIFLALYIAIVNASRGAVISLLIMLAIGFYGLYKEKKVNRPLVTICVLVSVALIYQKMDVIFDNLFYRLSVSNMLDGTTRYDVWERAWLLFVNNYGLGTGIGGLGKEMMAVSTEGEVLAVHNIFIEILIIHGIIILFFFVVSLFKLFFRALKVKYFDIRIVLLSAFLALPFYSIINSSYLQSPSLYVFFASLYVLIYCSKDGHNYNNCQNKL